MAKKSATALRRKNLLLGWMLIALAITIAVSVFVYRYSHNQAPLPQGGSYGQTYHPTQTGE